VRVVVSLCLRHANSYLYFKHTCAVVSLLRLTQLRWPSPVHQTFELFSLSMLNLGLTNTQCWISFGTNFYVKTYFPFGVFAILGFCYCIVLMLRQQSHGTVAGYRSMGHDDGHQSASLCFRLLPDLNAPLHSAKYQRRFRALLIRTYLTFLSFSYTFLSLESLVVFDCVSLNGELLLRDFVAVRCYSEQWYRYLISSIFGMVCYLVGIPLLMGWLLHAWQYGDRPGAYQILGLQILAYRPGFRWWDVASLLWKLAVVLTLRFLIDHSTAQIVVFITLLLGRLLAQRLLTPYESSPNNREEGVMMSLTAGVVLCGVIFYGTSRTGAESDVLTEVLFVVAIALMAALVLCTLYFVYRVYREGKAVDHAASEIRLVGIGRAQRSDSQLHPDVPDIDPDVSTGHLNDVDVDTHVDTTTTSSRHSSRSELAQGLLAGNR